MTQRQGIAAALVLFAIGAVAASASAQTPGFRREAGVTFSGQAIANPRGALSLSTNPAGLTQLWGWEARGQLSAGGGYLGGTKGNGWALFAAFGGADRSATAFSYERVTDAIGEPSRDDDPSVGVHRLSHGFAFRLTDTLHFGTAIRLAISEEPDRATPLFVDLGMLWRPWSWLSFGARVAGLSLGSYGSGEVEPTFPLTRWGWGVAVRPFAGSDRLTMALDVDWPAGDKLGDVTFTIGSRIIDGLSLLFEHRSAAQNTATGLPAQDDTRNMLMLSLGFGGWGGELAFGGTQSQLSGNTPALQMGARISGDHPHSLRDRGPGAVVYKLKGGFSEHGGGRLFTQAVLQLEELGRRPKTRLIVLRAEGLKLTWAQVEELREAIFELKKAGKKVVMYADSLGTRGYTVAVACDRIGLPEHGMLLAKGVQAGFMGLQQALARVGAAFETVRYGDYKSAPEQLTRTAISPQLKATVTRLVTRRWQTIAEAVALGRQMTVTEVEAKFTAGVVYPPDALAARMIDAVEGPKGFEKKLRDWHLLRPGESLSRYSRGVPRPHTWAAPRRIALVAVTGTIVGGRSGNGPLGREIGGAEVAKHIRKVTRDKSVKGIAVRIDSPGGSVSGSDIMYQALRDAAKRKPVYASMASVAASGGYWTAMGADRVYADASTITGSIGIFTLKPNLSGTWRQLGVGMTLIGAGPHPAILSLHKGWTPQERAFMHKTMGRFYGLFLDRVGKHRKLERARLLSLAEGRIWLGDEALGHRLVDEVGGVSKMLRGLRAKMAIDPDDPLLITVWPKLTFTQELMRSLGLAQVAASPTASALQDPSLRPVVQALAPWLDTARIIGLFAGKPAALAPIDVDQPAP